MCSGYLKGLNEKGWGRLSNLRNEWIRSRRTAGYAANDGTLVQISELSRRRKAADPRDNVYSLLGLYKWDLSELIPVVYSIEVTELFKRVAIVEFSLSGNVKFLNFCYAHSHLALPSWVPDWTVDFSLLQSNAVFLDGLMYRACGSKRATVSFDAEGGFTAMGTIISTILCCTSALDTDPSSVYGITGANANGTRPYGNSAISTIEACRLAILAGLDYDAITGHWHRIYSITCPKAFEAWETSSPKPKTLSATFTMETVHRTASVNRRFVVLESGYFGFAHQDCKLRDIVVALGGGLVLYVLRSLRTDRYMFVGTAYIQEMMDGEAFQDNPHLQDFTIV